MRKTMSQNISLLLAPLSCFSQVGHRDNKTVKHKRFDFLCPLPDSELTKEAARWPTQTQCQAPSPALNNGTCFLLCKVHCLNSFCETTDIPGCHPPEAHECPD
jgi:hypothetical protein